jgi:hypothetical protein
MNGQQNILHHVIDAVRCYPAPARDCLDDGYAASQQRLVRNAVTGLGSGHQSRPVPVSFRGVRIRFRHHLFGDLTTGA